MEIYSSESSESDDEDYLKTLDFSLKFLDTQTLYENIEYLIATELEVEKLQCVSRLNIYENMLTDVPENIYKFSNLKRLDISKNRIERISEILTRLPLYLLNLRRNYLSDLSFPKSLGNLEHSLEVLNLSGNNLTVFPEQIFSVKKLKYLYLGENHLKEIPSKIQKLNRLEILSLGGNKLQSVPNSLCQLHELKILVLSDNKLESLPACIANLKKLRTLQVHRNKLKTLPNEIVKLKRLSELNLRENPLVNKFINDLVHDPPTLQELSARVIKLHKISYSLEDVPKMLYDYLESAQHCVNPRCKGVYFDNRVEHVKFVDFCSKYRVPLLQYLCSTKCIDPKNNNCDDDDDEKNDNASNNSLMKKVLLG